MKPKIALGLFDFHIGGIETFLKNIANRLKGKYEFYFIATASPEIQPHFKEIGTALYCPQDKLEPLLKKIKPDIFQVHNEQAQIDAAVKAGVKNIIERTDGTRSCGRLKKDKLKLVIASAQGTIPIIKKAAPPNLPIHLIYNGINLEEIDKEQKTDEVYTGNEFVIGRSSRFGWGKNLILLIEAIKILVKEFEDIRLCLIGGDSVLPSAPKNLPKLQTAAKGYEKYIQFLGYKQNIIPYTKRFDIGTCVSRPNNEGIPNSLMESMVCSKPVIATDIDQVSELVNSKNGILIANDDLNALVAAIKYLYFNKDVRIKLGQSGRETIETKFNIEMCSQQYDNIYQSLI